MTSFVSPSLLSSSQPSASSSSARPHEIPRDATDFFEKESLGDVTARPLKYDDNFNKFWKDKILYHNKKLTSIKVAPFTIFNHIFSEAPHSKWAVRAHSSSNPVYIDPLKDYIQDYITDTRISVEHRRFMRYLWYLSRNDFVGVIPVFDPPSSTSSSKIDTSPKSVFFLVPASPKNCQRLKIGYQELAAAHNVAVIVAFQDLSDYGFNLDLKPYHYILEESVECCLDAENGNAVDKVTDWKWILDATVLLKIPIQLKSSAFRQKRVFIFSENTLAEILAAYNREPLAGNMPLPVEDLTLTDEQRFESQVLKEVLEWNQCMILPSIMDSAVDHVFIQESVFSYYFLIPGLANAIMSRARFWRFGERLGEREGNYALTEIRHHGDIYVLDQYFFESMLLNPPAHRVLESTCLHLEVEFVKLTNMEWKCGNPPMTSPVTSPSGVAMEDGSGNNTSNGIIAPSTQSTPFKIVMDTRTWKWLESLKDAVNKMGVNGYGNNTSHANSHIPSQFAKYLDTPEKRLWVWDVYFYVWKLLATPLPSNENSNSHLNTLSKQLSPDIDRVIHLADFSLHNRPKSVLQPCMQYLLDTSLTDPVRRLLLIVTAEERVAEYLERPEAGWAGVRVLGGLNGFAEMVRVLKSRV